MTTVPATSSSESEAVLPAVAGGGNGAPPGELAEQLGQLQKLASLGTMAAMIAHEFNNLLTRAINQAEQAQARAAEPEVVREALKRILDNCTKAAEIGRSIFEFAGKSGEGVRPVALARLVQEAVNCLGRDPAKDNIALRCRIDPGLTIQGNPTLLQQVLYNLLLNARQAILAKSRTGGRLVVSADRTADGQVAVRVQDNGCGIPPENLGKIFSPFFSTKTADGRTDRRGIGLGLAICRSIVSNHGGTIQAESAVGQGATFTISLPGN